MSEYKICRACLSHKKSFTYFLFENVSPDTYKFCTSIRVKENDDLPRMLCSPCYDLIIKYTEFKNTCINSQNTLLQHRKNDSNSLVEETEYELLLNNVKMEDNLNERAMPLIIKLSPDDGEDPNCEDIDVKEEDFLNHSDDDVEDPNCKDIDVKEEDFSNNVDDDSFLEIQLEPMQKMIQHKRKSTKKLKLKRVKKKIDLKQAMTKKHSDYSCELCPRKFKYPKRFADHKLEHGIEKNIQCTACNKNFQTATGLKRHVASAHAAVRLASVVCAKCGRVCPSEHALKAHEKMHSAKQAQVVCDVCGKRVSTAVVLKAHLETHKVDRERRYTCEHCGKKFYTNTKLQVHIKRQHTGQRFICGLCTYPFTNKQNLAKHILSHYGKKQAFKCDFCDKSYATNSSLTEHKRIHSGERPFSCMLCPKSFLSNRRLMDHQRIHTGDKPHKCDFCEQRFTQRGTRNRHMKKVHDMKVPALVE